jgi:rRNA maturation RNase YbeY
MEQSLHLFSEDINFTIDKEDSVRSWILFVIDSYEKKVGDISYIFCSDEYLLGLNQQHLNHDYYTDILTFPYAPSDSVDLFADIYISIDRVKDNASALAVSFEEELHRVMVHGILHLVGYDDHGEGAKKEMREREDRALQKRTFV